MNGVNRQHAAALEMGERLWHEFSRWCEDDSPVQPDARVLPHLTRPDSPEFERELAVVLLPSERVHLALPVQRDLNREMRRSAKADQSQPGAR